MSKAAALACLQQDLGASCEYSNVDGGHYTCNASVPTRATYQVDFTAVPPSVLRSVVYTFFSTHDLQTVIGDVSRSFGYPSPKKDLIDRATWRLSSTLKLHLRGGGDDYHLILDDDAIARRDYEELQRSRNEAPPPPF